MSSPPVEATFRVSYPNVDQLLVAYASDLSKGGMFMPADQLLPVDAQVRLLLDLGAGSTEIPIVCRVAWVRDAVEARRSGQPAGLGLEFLDLTEECLGLIESFIAERIAAVDSEAPLVVPKRRLSVLIVDDDHGFRTLAAAPFRDRGDYVRTAADGAEALALCMRDLPDVIISDVHMPKMDGWALLRVVRSRQTLQSVPFVFLTTLGGEAERLRGYQLGVDDYIAKPFRGKELQARIDRILARLQAAPAVAVDTKTLRGDLVQVSLASMLTFLEMERKTGELVITAGAGKTAHLFLQAGRPLRVELAGELGGEGELATLYRVLDWTEGEFEFVPREVDGEQLLQLSLTGALLEHARLRDEANRGK
jgi:two-component system OmpR family response regulator